MQTVDKPLFEGIIYNDHGSWHDHLRMPNAFNRLIKHIYQINHIQISQINITQMPVGAVFRVGDTVIKIFVPPELGEKFCDDREYITELSILEHARNAGILVPDVICCGTVRDKRYTFDYIVMNYIEGIIADDVLPGFTDAERNDFALKFKNIADKLHVTNPDLPIPHFDEPGKINHPLWNNMPESFRADRLRYIENADFPESVVCQGDINGGNVIIDQAEKLYLIDFSESVHAPAYYDLPLIYDYKHDKVLMTAFYGDYQNDAFYDKVTMAVLLNWFSGVNIGWLAEEANVDVNGITSVSALRDMLIQFLR